MQVSEKEFNTEKNKIKRLFKVFIFLYVIFLAYYFYYNLIWNQRLFLKEQIFGDLGSQPQIINYGYSTEDINEIVTEFDDDFLKSEVYKSLSGKIYDNLSQSKTGKKNPFNQY